MFRFLSFDLGNELGLLKEASKYNASCPPYKRKRVISHLVLCCPDLYANWKIQKFYHVRIGKRQRASTLARICTQCCCLNTGFNLLGVASLPNTQVQKIPNCNTK